MKESEIKIKRRFWKNLLTAGFLVLVITLLMIVIMYLTGMKNITGDFELQREIALIAVRNELLFKISKWALPFAISAMLLINLARYKLRKLNKLF